MQDWHIPAAFKSLLIVGTICIIYACVETPDTSSDSKRIEVKRGITKDIEDITDQPVAENNTLENDTEKAESITAACNALPDFHLKDINPSSATNNENIGPDMYRNQISVWYFLHTT